MFLVSFTTPLGEMIAGATNQGICLLDFADRNDGLGDFIVDKSSWANKHLVQLVEEVDEYFNKKRKSFTVPIVLEGTAFQKSVWNTLLNIPYGEVWSYKKQAEALGDINKVRAVAGANAKNKISIIVPCHRVIASSGKLSGYAGGVWRKEKLLKLERDS